MVNVASIWETDFKDIQAYIETEKGNFVASYEDSMLSNILGIDTDDLYDLIGKNDFDSLENVFATLVFKDKESYFKLPKLSKCSNLLQELFETVLESDNGMFFYEYEDWENDGHTEEDLNILEKEIKKYGLQEVIEIKENNCIITCYSDLITRFIDDRGVDNE